MNQLRACLSSRVLIASTLVLLAMAGATAAQISPISHDDAHHRAEALLKQMTVEEKVGQLNQASGIVIPGLAKEKPDAAIVRGQVGSVLWQFEVKDLNRLQHLAVEKSRLHIPLLIGFYVIHGYRTICPVPLAMASSWDPAVEEAAQHQAALDARAAGIQWTFTPMVDIARDARWGRIVEGAGEDPYLGAAMAAAQVRGFQGESIGPNSVLACVKHFAGYGAAEGGRDYDSSYIPEVLLRNVYLVPFHAAEKAGAATFMSAYMDLNDVPATGNRWLLHDVLRETWKYSGFVVSDANAVHSLITHGYARDGQDAAMKAFSAGLNMDMASGMYLKYLSDEVKQGRITNAQLDAAVLPILETKIKLGLFEHPYIDETRIPQVLNAPESQELARRAVERSVVLLRNQQALLPLDKRQIRSIAVIGPLADAELDLLGMWGAMTKPGPTVSILQGIKNKVVGAVHVEFAHGPNIR